MPIYIFDTSAIADIFERYYPSDVFPSVKQLVVNLATEGRMIVPRDVREELGDPIYGGWLDGLNVVREFEELTTRWLAHVMADVGQRMVDPRGTRNGADPIVVAYAHAFSAIVVTSEGSAPNSTWMKIPDACVKRGLTCQRVLDVFRAENLKL